MKRLGLLGFSMFLLTGCTDSVEQPIVPVDTNEPSSEEITVWTREDFKDVFDQYEKVSPLLKALENDGLTPFRETFEHVAIAGDGIHHTYADIYPFKLDDGTYATVYESENGDIVNGTESVAPLFWQEASFLQFVEEIEQRKNGTNAPPTDVV